MAALFKTRLCNSTAGRLALVCLINQCLRKCNGQFPGVLDRPFKSSKNPSGVSRWVDPAKRKRWNNVKMTGNISL